MKIEQIHFKKFPESSDLIKLQLLSPHLLLIFGDVNYFSNPNLFNLLISAFPNANLVGCSTAGEIIQEGVYDNSLTLTAVQFNQPDFKVVETPLNSMQDSEQAGIQLANALEINNLNDVLVFAPGVNINGSALIQGLSKILPNTVKISGGLAGDSGTFTKTWTISPSGISENSIVAIGFYNQKQKFYYSNYGGWKPFGPARQITHCENNILYTLDNQPALEVYRRYLGDYASQLPASGLLFPFEMLEENHHETGLVRTILGIDEEKGSLILAGDIIPNGFLKLMHSSPNDLVDGAEHAGELIGTLGDQQSLGILVSCVGRKIVMGDRVDEEIEVIADLFTNQCVLTGFYSNGEISPQEKTNKCQLHNQTMTITCITEEL